MLMIIIILRMTPPLPRIQSIRRIRIQGVFGYDIRGGWQIIALLSLNISIELLVSAPTPMPSEIGIEELELEAFELQSLEDTEAMIEAEVEAKGYVFAASSAPLAKSPRNQRM